MSGEMDLPTLRVADLDEAGIDELFLDLCCAAEILDVSVKGSSESRCASTVPTFDAARAALREQGVRGVQVRYRFAGRVWCDTLMRSRAGARLVRAELPSVVSP